MSKAAIKREMINRARELAPQIKALAHETEKARKPLDSIITKLEDAGLFGMLIPERWGGPELDLQTHHAVVEIISAACMSTGWITSFYSGHAAIPSRFSEKAQAEVFANGPRCRLPATTTSALTARSVAGGWEVSGRASWGSGIMHADWVLVGGQADDGRRFFMIPASDVGYDDVWHMSGMAGTGSNDIVLDSVFVPFHRSEFAAEVLEGRSEGARSYNNPLYSMPIMPFIYCEVLGVFTGGLIGAKDEFHQITKRRVITHSGQATNERSHNHIQLGAAAAAVLGALAQATFIVRDIEARLDSNDFSMTDRLQLKALTALTIDQCRRAINDMINRAGASSFRNEAALQRIFRDMNTVSIHAYWDWEVSYELLGRHLVDLAPNNPLF